MLESAASGTPPFIALPSFGSTSRTMSTEIVLASTSNATPQRFNRSMTFRRRCRHSTSARQLDVLLLAMHLPFSSLAPVASALRPDATERTGHAPNSQEGRVVKRFCLASSDNRLGCRHGGNGCAHAVRTVADRSSAPLRPAI
jgi:hypothetical protein